jgi:hypothetical protein
MKTKGPDHEVKPTSAKITYTLRRMTLVLSAKIIYTLRRVTLVLINYIIIGTVNIKYEYI